MRFVNRDKGMTPGTTVTAAALVCVAVWMLSATTGGAQISSAQDQRTGVSHPDSAPITVDSDAVPARAKPSAAIPPTKTAPTSNSETVYGPYVPYRAPGAAEPTPAVGANAFDPDANIVTPETMGRRPLSEPGRGTAKEDLDAGIVTHVPSRAGEVPDGTLVRVKLREELSTLTTKPGTKFTAEVSEPVMRDGSVIVPVGSVMEGRVTWVRGGKRIGGQAAIHLEPRTVTLPDGTQYVLRARAIDTSSWENTKVDSEGTIMRGENKKRNAGVMALTTGGGMAAGAMIGGVPGAVIGAGVGAGVSTVVWLKQDRQAVLPKDLGLIFSLTEPMSITPASAILAPVKAGEAGGGE